MRLVFLGSPEAAVPSLKALIDAGHEIVLVVTQPDRRRGRGGDLIPTPVKAAAIVLAAKTKGAEAGQLMANAINEVKARLN